MTDTNKTGYIDAGDLLSLPAWANGLDTDGNGFVDDLVGWSFGQGNNRPTDQFGHGTHVAGTIGAVGDNGTGVVGVNWDVQIMPLGLGFSPSTATATAAMNYVATMRGQQFGVNVRATNNSYGVGVTQAFFDAAKRTSDADVLLVAAAGNFNQNNDTVPSYPANFDLPNVISVAATDRLDNKAGFSNFGKNTVDLAAPGVAILSTMVRSGVQLTNPTGYGLLDGTSMASPHVAGAIALAAAASPGSTGQQIKAAMLANVDLIPALANITVTGGRLNVARTIQALGFQVAGTTPAAGS